MSPPSFHPTFKRILTAGNRYLFRDIQDRRFDLFRICLALSALACLLGSWNLLAEQLTSSSFHPQSLYLPKVPALPPFFLDAFRFGLAALLLGLALGWIPRLCAAASAFGYAYWYTVDPISGGAHMKLIVFGFALIALCPTGLKRTLWPIRIIQWTLLVVYFFAGWRKVVFGGWLENPDTLWIHLAGSFRTETGASCLNHLPQLLFSLGQYATLIFELGAPLLFLDKRLRPVALASGILFHLLIALMMDHLIYFSVTMLSFYWAFVPEFAGSERSSSGQDDTYSAAPGISLK